jgi:hypothetical protein
LDRTHPQAGRVGALIPVDNRPGGHRAAGRGHPSRARESARGQLRAAAAGKI